MEYLLYFLSFFFANHTPKHAIYPDVLHYGFQIELNDQNDTILTDATILLTTDESTDAIKLDLGSLQGDTGLGMQITQLTWISLDENGTESPLDYLHQNDRILIHRPLSKNDTVRVHIQYKGVPKDGLIISKNKYGHRTFFADNWPDRGHHWLVCHDDPSDKASLEFKIIAPDHYQVVANGIRMEETNLPSNSKLTVWKEEVPLSTKVMVIGVADFAVNLAGYVHDCIPIYSWVYPEDKEKGFYDYALAKEILPFYIQYIGPYAYKKLANVESKTRFGGLENANTIFYSEKSIKGDRSNENMIAHEIAHQWFGNMATEKSFGHLWLSEGFATYFAMLYEEEKYGKEKMIELLSKSRNLIVDYSRKKNTPVIDTTTRDYMKLLNPNTYQKGGWVLHMLRMELGDSIFHQAIRQYYVRYAGHTAGTEDLQEVFESVSGQNLHQFFKQWLYTAGHPILTITWKFDPAAKLVTGTILQTQKDPYSFPLDLSLVMNKKENIRHTLPINTSMTTFSFDANEKPIDLLVDPDTKLLHSHTISPIK
ncbi:MAG: M1 family peptidase [Saprospiraceae bacterium]|nr:M1 family peptidase [Saprospiraceae bacterium]